MPSTSEPVKPYQSIVPPDYPARPAAAIAILYRDNRFLLQLRDDIPEIFYPGTWGFFGGQVEPDELPIAAVQRELEEEIGYQPPQIQHFCSYLTHLNSVRHVFYAPLVVGLEELQLNEGQDLGLFTIEEVQQGYCFSVRLGQNRPLAAPPRQILLDFLQRHPNEIPLIQ
jgi:8-oxo-dGTP pyrophosphatase MutT (NUDIX family)